MRLCQLHEEKWPYKVKFYHASPRRLPVGSLIVPAREIPHIKPVFPQIEGSLDTGTYVYLTTSPIPHETVTDKIETSDRPWHVYEVEPIGEMQAGQSHDVLVKQARVVRYVGNALGLLQKAPARPDRDVRRPGWKGSHVDFARLTGPKIKYRPMGLWPDEREMKAKEAERLAAARARYEKEPIPKRTGFSYG
jgi:hypothetical protein